MTRTVARERISRASRNATGSRRSRGLGLDDLGRQAAGDVTGPFTFWDYRAGAFHEDGACGSTWCSVRRRCASGSSSVEVDREERKPTAGEGKPSDHAPVVASFRELAR